MGAGNPGRFAAIRTSDLLRCGRRVFRTIANNGSAPPANRQLRGRLPRLSRPIRPAQHKDSEAADEFGSTEYRICSGIINKQEDIYQATEVAPSK